jgi:hypothetical protein
MRDVIKLRGRVTVRLLDERGKVREFQRSWGRRLLRLPPKRKEYRRHNIVTRQGDALIADALLVAPTQTKVSSASGFMQVGTGWTGNSTKTNTRCNAPTGAMEALDVGYPVLTAAWGAVGDTTVRYRATFEAGKLAANGINEVALLNGSGAGASCLAYAQITPAANVTANDTLQIEWEITLLGQ